MNVKNVTTISITTMISIGLILVAAVGGGAYYLCSQQQKSSSVSQQQKPSSINAEMAVANINSRCRCKILVGNTLHEIPQDFQSCPAWCNECSCN